jgi:DNA-binding XRE family transcriptional regulator
MEFAEYRFKNKKSQQECAQELQISRQYVSDIETKKVKPGRKLTEKIIDWSDKQITIADLWNWDTGE